MTDDTVRVPREPTVKPIDMTSFFDAEKGTRGNCLSACLAMLFDVPLEIVPHFASMHEATWMENLRTWLTLVGRDWMYETDGSYPQGFYIANGPAKRGVRHSVVMKAGEVFHDPHPSRDGLLSIDSVWWFPMLAAAPQPSGEEWKLVPVNPPMELLVSMALRANHGFGLDDDRAKEIQLSDMKKVYEEVVGIGFYHDDRKEYYRSMLPPAPKPDAAEGEG